MDWSYEAPVSITRASQGGERFKNRNHRRRQKSSMLESRSTAPFGTLPADLEGEKVNLMVFLLASVPFGAPHEAQSLRNDLTTLADISRIVPYWTSTTIGYCLKHGNASGHGYNKTCTTLNAREAGAANVDIWALRPSRHEAHWVSSPQDASCGTCGIMSDSMQFLCIWMREIQVIAGRKFSSVRIPSPQIPTLTTPSYTLTVDVHGENVSFTIFHLLYCYLLVSMTRFRP